MDWKKPKRIRNWVTDENHNFSCKKNEYLELAVLNNPLLMKVFPYNCCLQVCNSHVINKIKFQQNPNQQKL